MENIEKLLGIKKEDKLTTEMTRALSEGLRRDVVCGETKTILKVEDMNKNDLDDDEINERRIE